MMKYQMESMNIYRKSNDRFAKNMKSQPDLTTKSYEFDEWL